MVDRKKSWLLIVVARASAAQAQAWTVIVTFLTLEASGQQTEKVASNRNFLCTQPPLTSCALSRVIFLFQHGKVRKVSALTYTTERNPRGKCSKMSEVTVWNGNVDQSERFNVFQFDQLVCFHFDWIKYCLWIHSCVLYSFMTAPFDVLCFLLSFFDVFFLLFFDFFNIYNIFIFMWNGHFSFIILHIFL